MGDERKSERMIGVPPAELKAGPEPQEQLQPIAAPTFYCSAFRVMGTGTDFTLILQRNVPVEAPDGSINSNFAKLQTEALVFMGPQALKDLYILLAGQVEQHEREFGKIVTPYTKRIDAEN